MKILFAGFIMGLLGSLHCAGMCGPIALNLPLKGKHIIEKFWSGIVYNFGRILMYGILGAIFGLLGKGLFLLGLQQWISIAMGVFLICSVLLPLVFNIFKNIEFNFFKGFVRNQIQSLFRNPSLFGLFLIGMFNGLLPCGLVYIAILAAVAFSNLYTGSIYLIMFGLGTLPMMITIALLGNILTITVRNIFNKIIPYVVVFVGIIFVLRGLCLGIPYISPAKENLEISIMGKTEHNENTNMEKVHDCCHPNKQ